MFYRLGWWCRTRWPARILLSGNASSAQESHMKRWGIVQLFSGEWIDCLRQRFEDEQEAYLKLRELKREQPNDLLRVVLLDESGNELPYQALRRA